MKTCYSDTRVYMKHLTWHSASHNDISNEAVPTGMVHTL
jgi:hypothetical protein